MGRVQTKKSTSLTGLLERPPGLLDGFAERLAIATHDYFAVFIR